MLSTSEFFDANYYGDQVRRFGGKAPRELFAHYESVGWRFGLDPHPLFSTNGYLAENPDVWKAGVNPLDHYEKWGRAEQRTVASVAEYEGRHHSKKIIRRVELLDLKHYQAQVTSERFSDVLSALDHYLETGWRLGLDPHPTFSTAGYLNDNGDVAEDGTDPLTHFVHHGYFEGRLCVDPVAFAQPGYRTPGSPWAAEIRESLSAYLRHLAIDFDARDVDLHGDVFAFDAQVDWFDSDFYLDLYDDVAKAGIPAFTHFVLAGHREGRFPNPSVRKELTLRDDTERVLLARTLSVQTCDEGGDGGPGLRSGSSVITEIIDRGLLEGDRVIIAFAHDDYAEHVGGIQIVSAREEAMFRDVGDSYVSIFPHRESLALSALPPDEFLVRCRIGGELLDGAFPLVEFAQAFSGRFAERRVVVVMHSVLGHSPEAIEASVELLRPSVACWWVHDYSAHCQNYRLTRNGVNWCGDPAPDSQSCQLCSFGHVRGRHLDRVRSLIDGVDWVFAAPSEVAAEQSVGGSTPLPRRPLVIPHGSIWRDGATRDAHRENEKVRIAFVGHPAAIKGWNRFVAFVSDAGAEAANFEFFHLGIGEQFVPGVTFVELRPEQGGRSVATKKLLDHGIDAVVNFVDGKETFNFVTFEAMAAGCCIVTSSRSGNVIAAATDENLVIEVGDDCSKFDYSSLHNEILRKRRNDVGEFRFTGLTPALIAEVTK